MDVNVFHEKVENYFHSGKIIIKKSEKTAISYLI